nr:HU family DNA-binding protein [Hydrogenobacter thermophilus]
MKHNRQTIAKLLAEQTGYKEKEAKEILEALIETIRREVLKGEKIEIRGLATWKLKNGKVKVKNHIKARRRSNGTD